MPRQVEKDFTERMLSGAKVIRVLETLKIDPAEFEAMYNAMPRDRQSPTQLKAIIADLESKLAEAMAKIGQPAKAPVRKAGAQGNQTAH